MKDGEGFRQRTYMHSPWTQTTAWRLAWEGGVGGERAGPGGGREREKKVETTVTE